MWEFREDGTLSAMPRIARFFRWPIPLLFPLLDRWVAVDPEAGSAFGFWAQCDAQTPLPLTIKMLPGRA